MPGTLTITSACKNGTGIDMDGTVLNNVKTLSFDIDKGICSVEVGSQMVNFALGNTDNISIVISGVNYTILAEN